jgi:hypothetical protein
MKRRSRLLLVLALLLLLASVALAPSVRWPVYGSAGRGVLPGDATSWWDWEVSECYTPQFGVHLSNTTGLFPERATYHLGGWV